MSKNGEIYTTGKNFTLPPAVTAWTNSTSASSPRNAQPTGPIYHFIKFKLPGRHPLTSWGEPPRHCF